MTLQELLEHAHLDALGQLDEREQAAFEAAFAVAPPAIKAQVRHEQARWAPMEHLLPQVEPSPELRERVLDAVTTAMLAQERGDLSLRSSRRVSPAWRSAAIGLLSAVVVLGAAFVYIYDTNRETNAITGNDRQGESYLTTWSKYMKDAVLDPGTHAGFFAATDAKFAGKGSVWTNPKWAEGRFFFDLPKNADGEEYRVVVVDASAGGMQIVGELDRFTSTGLLSSREIQTIGLPAGTQLALVAARVNEPASADRILLTVTI
jgi:hypothetical protein